MLGFYLAYEIFFLNVQVSTAIATLALIAGGSSVAAGLSTLYDSRTIAINVGFGCVLTFLLLIFFGFCLVVGILAATLVLGTQ